MDLDKQTDRYMTPKEKALELYGNMLEKQSANDDFEYMLECAKKCSLIVIDEIINTDSLISDEVMETTAHLSYWEDVKRELVNL